MSEAASPEPPTEELPHDLEQLLELSIAICRGDWDGVRRVRRAAGPGAPDRAWREAVLQVHLFAGIPRTVEACAVLLEEGGLGAADPSEQEAGPPLARGRALFALLYGEAAPAVESALGAAHPGLTHVVLEHAYAGVLSRPGLAPAARELLAVGCLAASDLERQLASHARGAARLGVTTERIVEAARSGSAALEPARQQALVACARRMGTGPHS